MSENRQFFVDSIWKSQRLKAFQEEEKRLHPKAAFSKDHERARPEEWDYRLPYQRDVDRIVHSKAFSRYVDKTQVVYLVQDDHIAHRGLHVQLVSHFARGIAKTLQLNEDLVEAIALGHDVGHPPFGHEGEGLLSELSLEHGNGPFIHNYQSCRLLSEIEPLNLGLAVYDGFLAHSGGLMTSRLVPQESKSWQDHLKEREKKKEDPQSSITPMTLEGCLVKLCDKISYIGRDIEDAIYLGIISRDQIPKTLLGSTNREILRAVAIDLVHASYDKNEIALSQEVFDALKLLRRFNFEQIYFHPKIKVESNKVARSMRLLFELLLRDFKRNYKTSFLWEGYLKTKTETYLNQTSEVQYLIDYISGMTDNFFVRTLKSLIFPKPIEL